MTRWQKGTAGVAAMGVAGLLAAGCGGAAPKLSLAPTTTPTTPTTPTATASASPATAPAPGAGTGSSTLLLRPVLCELPGPAAPSAAQPPGTPPACHPASGGPSPTTPASGDLPRAQVVLTGSGPAAGTYVLGPADLTGSIVKAASAEPGSVGGTGYEIQLTLTPGGSVAFDRIAAERYRSFATGNCPAITTSCLEAFDLNGTVLNAAAIEAPTFNGSIQIASATPYTRTQALKVAAEINAARG